MSISHNHSKIERGDFLKKIRFYISIIGVLVFLCGCDRTVSGNIYETKSEIYVDNESKTLNHIFEEINDEETIDNQNELEIYSVKELESTNESIEESKENEMFSNVDLAIGTDNIYSLENLPDYNGMAYITLNNNIPEFSEYDKTITEPFEFYSELDNLGRCGQAYANICEEIEPIEERESIGSIKPSGWHTVKYNDLIDGNYLYNRCHLIGYQLAGENANEKNLITGTRYLNVVGMLEFENRVDDYVDSTGNHVLYRVTPIFVENNLVASGVQMEGWSVEDSGVGICFNVYCYNVQPGIEIDYATGDSCIAEEQTLKGEILFENEESNSEFDVEDEESKDAVETEILELVINTNTKKFHLPSCSSVGDMADHNKKMYLGTIQEVIDEGYVPCKRCLSQYKQ
jgi:DNA-entry nuclease